ncbi:50S ribosomal protein L11 [Candidatus Berkelbacteria bacterium CG_4_10_14_0_8_um_filter_35_9_33_8]|uniref:Large ribosomal subunit protein uL11 n=1 Tax=Candidatus Berkelbacteria bacterium CG_4_10_14_0_2_um_filter_35_9_33_12 TaxID=1974499 RepID=A0A2M7W486_9BACT|nr:MAG: 50S ribosomal protein L11 [Candidatus Berkelbacteria bacterium CG23_combo_of_CG06-09_8_20_14_all_33_15]PIS08148.1 MAG: 50S ribosomal protein L11 [Candidatus Berkelbacteria bacterium CG10_big_fil_rev_8_21_14_0_10_33_10]PIZ28356.1 MAG: 50S ribosomal protein L11 [Candidatus Berkelbacteria bacterium CG_4_10_14_0_8_um_filter_35_9_33_8]PJA20481.1 MAG: 50S ribosomal protein L11 [Candidatus Berkelbacteria bacterium CG_4_10_14_0_2_um_filter_35_9_33_12]PJB51950.1 MAG: 50S ribosomal protein L11 [C
MAKKIKTILKLQVPGGQATPAPPIGQVLGQHGLNIVEFTQAFNKKTQDQQGVILPVVMTVYEDRSFNFIIKSPTATYLIKKAVGVEKGSGETPKKKIGKVSRKQLEELAKEKLEDLNAYDVDQAVKILAGTARSMGVDVTE